MDEANEKLLNEYERAQEVALHTDGIVHEITSIAWAANTLLLGFILEVDCTKSSNQILVIIASVVGIVMTLYVPMSIEHIKRIQHIAYDVCGKIEDSLGLVNKLHTKIDEGYSKSKPGQRAVWVLTFIFIAAWIGVIINAEICLCHHWDS